MISFPATPALNDTYTVNQTTWRWTGTAWQIIARPVAAHKSTHAIGGSDALTPADIGAAEAIHIHAVSDTTGLQTALDSKIPATEKGAADGVATLDSAGKVPSTQLPSFVDDVIEAANFAALPATGETGKIYVTIDDRKTYRWSGTVYVEISAAPGSTDAVPEGSTNLYFTNARASAAAPVQSVAGRTGAVTITSTDLADFSAAASAAAPVQSVAGKTGAVTLDKSDVGLANVDNTSDLDKPISTATQTALDGKQIKTVYSDTAPAHVAGLEWVDTTDLRSYRSYNSAWVEIDRA
jgi:hypothetical protein